MIRPQAADGCREPPAANHPPRLASVARRVRLASGQGISSFRCKTYRTRWLTADQTEQFEQFELTIFTPRTLRKIFEQAGFEVVELIGKTVQPVREPRALLESP